MVMPEAVFAVWILILIGLVALNRWAKRRGPHVVLDFDPSKPMVHWEDQEVI